MKLGGMMNSNKQKNLKLNGTPMCLTLSTLILTQNDTYWKREY